MRRLPWAWAAALLGLACAGAVALGAAAPLVAQARAARGPGASPGARGLAAISETDLRRELTFFAGDQFRGREAGTLDELRASDWLVERMRALGMEPVGDYGTFYQWWPMRRNRLASSSSASIGDRSLALWREAIVVAPTDLHVAAPPLWLGRTTEPELRRLDLKGRVAVAMLEPPATVPAPGVSLRAWRYARAAVARQGRLLRELGAAAVILVADSLAEEGWDFFASATSRGTYAVDSAGIDQRPRPTPPILLVRSALADTLRAATLVTLDLRTESFVYPSVNLVGKLPGADPKSEEFVLFSSHQDHDGVRHAVAGDSIWNGADDNGSVSVGLLGIARAWKAEPGRRAALFVFHGAEERGLLGSNWFSAHPTVRAEQIVAVLNADMIGRGPADSAALLGRFPPHRNSARLAELALQANDLGPRFALDTLWDRPEHPEGWYFRSDHLPYARRGFPALMFSTLLHPDYHTPRDEADRIDYAKLKRMAGWMYLTGKLVADEPARVRVDDGFKLER